MGNGSLTSIREVAKLAGVSPATVSRVMNGTANVNEEKKKRVEAAIKETGFQPNELARALYKKSSKMIGMIVPDIENPFFSELAKAVEDTAYQNGYRIWKILSRLILRAFLFQLQILPMLLQIMQIGRAHV